jgi:hypothetical protein
MLQDEFFHYGLSFVAGMAVAGQMAIMSMNGPRNVEPNTFQRQNLTYEDVDRNGRRESVVSAGGRKYVLEIRGDTPYLIPVEQYRRSPE